MSWTEYYDLLEKYGGDLRKATKSEMKSAARGNPNTPEAALELATKKYLLAKQQTGAYEDGDEEYYIPGENGGMRQATKKEYDTWNEARKH